MSRTLGKNGSRNAHGTFVCRRSTLSAFSLVEMLVVAGMVALLLTVTVPAIRGMMGSYGKVAAVDQLLSLFDHARSLALAQGRSTYVAFADADSQPDYRCRAAAIFQDTEDLANPPAQITPWQELPPGYCFSSSPDSPSLLDIPQEQTPSETTNPSFPRPVTKVAAPLPYVKFNASGAVAYPADSTRARLFLSLGYLDKEKRLILTGPQSTKSQAPQQIRLSVFTGRASYLTGDEPAN